MVESFQIRYTESPRCALHSVTINQGFMAHLICLSISFAKVREWMLSGADALGSGCSQEQMLLGADALGSGCGSAYTSAYERGFLSL